MCSSDLYASNYSYAQRILAVIYNITTGPSIRIFNSRVSSLWSHGKGLEIRRSMKEYMKVSLPLLLLSIIVSYFLVPEVLGRLGSRNLSASDISGIQFLFLCLAAWYLVLASETAFTIIGIASKNSAIFIKCNTVFSLIYFAVAFGTKGHLGIYAIPLGLFLGQTANLASYSAYAFKLLKTRGGTPAWTARDTSR